MSIEQNKAIVRRWNEEIWTGNQSVFDELLACDCVAHWMGGAQELKETINRIRAVFSNISLTIEDQFAAEDKVVTRWTLRGIHKGELWGVNPTGKRLAYKGISINRIANGQIVEEWCESDLFDLMRQIGVIPAVGEKHKKTRP